MADKVIVATDHDEIYKIATLAGAEAVLTRSDHLNGTERILEVVEKYNFGLSFQRRAYKIGAYYKPYSESVGIKFQIFNFDYSGFSGGFW